MYNSEYYFFIPVTLLHSSSEGNSREVIAKTEIEAKTATENHDDPSRF